MTEEEFRQQFLGHIATREGVIILYFKNGRLRVTDYLPGGINVWLKAEHTADMRQVALEVCRVNGWIPLISPEDAGTTTVCPNCQELGSGNIYLRGSDNWGCVKCGAEWPALAVSESR